MSRRTNANPYPFKTRADLEDDIFELEAQNKKLSEELEKSKKEAKAQEERATKVYDTAKQKWDDEKSDLTKKLQAAEAAKQTAEQAAKDAEKRAKDAETAKAASEKRAQDAEADKAKAEKVLADAAAANKVLEGEIDDLKQKLAAAPKAIAKGEGLGSDLSFLSMLTDAEKEELNAALDKVEELKEKAHKVARRQDTLKGVI